MSGPPRVRSMNVTVGADSDSKAARPVKNVKKPVPAPETEKKKTSPQCVVVTPAVLKRRDHCGVVGMKNMSMNASCSSDASSTDSSACSSGASSSGKVARRVGKKQVGAKVEKVSIDAVVAVPAPVEVESIDGLEGKKRCAWVTPNTEPCYIAFHDEEWGVPIHDDKKLFELLSFSGALAELSWPTILGKRQLFRKVFLDFDPCAVSRMNEKKIVAPGSPASSLLSELRLRSIIENARQMCKVIEEFGSFDSYIWNFVNNKPIVSQFRYPRQVPAKSPKAEFISKDLVKRGFRSVGPTVIYTFMQVAGLTNDHLIGCFRFKECIFSNAEAEGKESSSLNSKVKEKSNEDPTNVGLLLSVNKLSFSS
ncbi:putative DNA-3-methyladenine glycosylase I [Medicago truncatula]|uniref:DNA-3-methyladenine glycosylase I n=1 Tax=Medicago truncatula TaxID=3880 RepID=G7JEF4_MEDTR|nr:probable GMP synthase [glutamine-hydrolyzing] [Medicago truncatula]AES86444.2 DNA-3-methyladenine glycosylase I [Medicago truncatula]RHN58338.1 putative DNA-3-methyladenine glycosylase I [Medicago truncatula]